MNCQELQNPPQKYELQIAFQNSLLVVFWLKKPAWPTSHSELAIAPASATAVQPLSEQQQTMPNELLKLSVNSILHIFQ
jgi:hypothetical protein